MVANVTSPEVRGLQAEFPNTVGNLFSPNAWQSPHGVYALDNGRFTPREWSADAYLRLLDRARAFHRKPQWALVPDVVADWEATKAEWKAWRPKVESYGWPLAVAVQDGATVADVRAMSPQVVFVGGSTRWKVKTAAMWCAEFARVHVARVNTPRRAWACYKLGVESVDGTGWMRTTIQRKGLRTFLGMMAKREPIPMCLFSATSRNGRGESCTSNVVNAK